MRAVADAGPIIHLSWINLLSVLPRLCEEVTLASAVEREVMTARPEAPGIEAIRMALSDGWLHVRPIHDVAAAAQIQAVNGLDRGESETIVLFRETDADIVLMDDRRARLYAVREGLVITGTIGVLRLARDHGLISSVPLQLAKLRSRGFRISASLAHLIEEEEA